MLDDRGKIVGFQEKPTKGTELSKLANTGVYAFSPAIFEHIPRGEFYDFGNQVFPALQGAGEPFYGFEARGAYWADIGTPREYRRASYDVVRGVMRIPQTTPNGIDPSAKLAGDVSVEGPVRVGPGVWSPRACASSGRASSTTGVRVESGAQLERAICWQGATIGARAELRDTVVGKGYVVEPSSVIADALVAAGA